MELQANRKKMSSLFDTAKWTFSLTEEEIRYLKNLLNKMETCSWQENHSYGIDLGIESFGLCTQPTEENIAIVEKFTNTEAFCDEITAAAVRVLCEYWNLAEKYEDLLCKFINSDDDLYEDTIHAAIRCMGNYCHATKNKEYISLLFSVFNNALSQYRKDEIQVPDVEYIYRALITVIWGDKPPKGSGIKYWDMKIPEDISEEVIQKIQALIR